MGTKLFAIVFATVLLSGCSVLEEINKIGRDEVASEEGTEKCKEGSTSKACPKKSVNGWANIRSLSSNEMKADIVSCSVGNAVQFTTRESCLARGGTPAGY